MPKYDLPDHTVSLVWSERNHDLHYFLIYHPAYEQWYDRVGRAYAPWEGDWLPWTPPVFPPRVQLNRRRAWATVGTRRLLLELFASDGIFRTASGPSWFYSDSVTDIDWIDPEFIDELPPDPRGAK